MGDKSPTRRVVQARSCDEPSVVVFIDPKWSFDLGDNEVLRRHDEGTPSIGSETFVLFLKEAKVTDAHEAILRSRFDAFSSHDVDVSPASYLTFDGFISLNAHFDLCSEWQEERFFRAMDRCCQYRLSFEDFLFGCAAASPFTPHILNSYTGYVRARYIFDGYNTSCSGTLEYEELENLIMDSRMHLRGGHDKQRRNVRETAQELGDVSVVTLRISGFGGQVCDLRVSTRWAGCRIRRELDRRQRRPQPGDTRLMLDADIDEDVHLCFFINGIVLGDDECLDKILPEGTSSVDVTIVKVHRPLWPPTTRPTTLDTSSEEESESDMKKAKAPLIGLERFVHVTFDKFYKAVTSEQLRGTSRLFRLQRSVFHARRSKSSSVAAAAVRKDAGGAGRGVPGPVRGVERIVQRFGGA